jgi:hypothetical protein
VSDEYVIEGDVTHDVDYAAVKVSSRATTDLTVIHDLAKLGHIEAGDTMLSRWGSVVGET